MNNNIRVRLNGLEVPAREGSTIAIPPSVGELIRQQFSFLKNSDTLKDLHSQHGGPALRAAFAIPGEEPLLLNTDPSSQRDPTVADIDIGCAMKLVTSSMLHDHIARGSISLKATAAETLGIASLQGTPGSNLSLQDLLNHQHGLEDEGVDPAEFLKDGRVDQPSLENALNKKAMRFAPGRHYSYSRAGHWLIGALLQQMEKTSFSEIIASQGFRVTGNTCPAMGGGCRISVAELLGFLRRRLDQAKNHGSCAPVLPNASNVIPLPGWHVFEKGIQFGWKLFPNGWLGHNVVFPSLVGVVRVHPDTGAALLLWVPPAAYAETIAKMFRGIFLEPLNIPRRLQDFEFALRKPSRFLGTFRSGKRLFTVQRAESSGLSAVLNHGSDTERNLQFTYRPASKDCFFADGVRGRPFSFIQFISSSEGAVEAVWNGQKVWPRVN